MSETSANRWNTTANPDPGQSARTNHNIAIWGAPGSGKTTFLAALNIALILKDGPWRLIGADGPSTDFLIEMTAALSQDQCFPQATSTLGRYRWFLSEKPELQPRRWGRKRKEARAWKIGIDVLDAPGRSYHSKRTGRGTEREDLLDSLAASRGIVFLFDPVREFKDGDAFVHLHGVLADLARRMLATGEYADDTLPHHLAVCVTKFDELQVLQTAQKLSLLSPDPEDPHRFPRVADEDAEELFQMLSTVSASGNAGMVLPTLKQYFRSDRIKFFVTSSIGFYLDPMKGHFDPDDHQNLISAYQIRGQARPINVMEPMLWLGRQLSAEGDDRGARR
ncbi:hypothetical protein AB0395_27190 [Streptosporangium sp. NPDC051023]|uniref:hypothetical protein n=1 Tax=Streptosporangium sp. NPDC051023 TaxID=3155410 RepID=UPI00344B141B